MTGIEHKRKTYASGSRVYRHDDVVEYYGKDEQFAVEYDNGADEYVVRHESSGDEMRIGAGYQAFPVRASPPSAPQSGDVALQDGTNWNPTASGAMELVVYNGTSWVSA